MPIKLSLREKVYIVAMFGDVPAYHRARLAQLGSFPTQAGGAFMREAKRVVGYVERITGPKPPMRPRGRRKRNLI